MAPFVEEAVAAVSELGWLLFVDKSCFSDCRTNGEFTLPFDEATPFLILFLCKF